MIKAKQFELGAGQETARGIAEFLNENPSYKELTITSVGGDNNGMILVVIRM